MRYVGAVVLAAVIIGIMAMACQRKTSVPRPKGKAGTLESASPTNVPPPAGVASEPEVVSMDDILARLDSATLPYKDAKNAIQRDEVCKEAITQAETFFANRRLKAAVKIRDVRMIKENEAEVAVGGYENVHYFSQKQRNLSLSACASTIQLSMSRDVARGIVPGQSLTFSGPIVFHPRKWGAVVRPVNGLQVGCLRIASSGEWIGTISIRDYRCQIGEQEFLPPYMSRSGGDSRK